MNIQLRKRHRRMWIIVLIFVMVAGHFAWRAVPSNPIAEIPISYCPVGMATCTSTHEEYNEADVFVWHAQKSDDIYLITLDLMRPLKSAFATVGLTSQPGESQKLIGQVAEMKSYSFKVPIADFADNSLVQVQDHLTGHVFTSITLKEIQR